ncbi:ABC transporter, permease domain protein, partial [Vibrio parahaemolyticus V-223/04]
NDDE